ncbi:MAG: FAD-dependent oxidoreductase [Clostridiales Family XIII bacterium]|jgi:dihydropyrimidine dehydrogenase (NAD+) subunit PreT|nr:FAD-dependent oxidoreductase [Clostridiales Family XIII bacterium]
MSKIKTGAYTAEAERGFDHRTAMEEAARCLLCHDAPCSAGCPAGTDPGKFIRSIRFRNPKGAAETIRENNVLGGTCARVCPFDRLCEEACSRCGIDRPIEIGKLQRYAVEQEKAFRMKILKKPRSNNGFRVACVGAGPASLACAAELAKAGTKVTIYEREQKAGGVLTYGITPARLPQKVVDWDIKSVEGLGVEFVFGAEIGGAKKGALTAEDLLAKEGFHAVFLGVGLWKSGTAGVPGEDLKNVLRAVDFLKQARTRGGFPQMQGKKVVVIGGGDVAMDCATTARLQGADVQIWYRRTIGEAPANMDEIRYALDLGIGLTQNFAPKAFTGKGGKVEYAVFQGRDGKSEAKVACDYAIFAIGQQAEDIGAVVSGAATTGKGCVAIRGGGRTSVKGVFAAGDITNGGSTVVEAVKEGKEAAQAILRYLNKGVK